MCLLTLGVWAKGIACAVERQETAQELARRALDCLRRGEDALDREARVAAYREGLAYARQAVAADDGNADAHFAVFANNGRLLLLEGATPNPIMLVQAQRELERALEINPNHANALAARGGLYRQLPWLLGGNLHKAEECLRRAIALNPTAVGARIELAATYRDMGRAQEGIPLLQDAIALASREHRFREQAEAEAMLRRLGTSE
jgi:tetratricopeptide (TPR) repeat protein